MRAATFTVTVVHLLAPATTGIQILRRCSGNSCKKNPDNDCIKGTGDGEFLCLSPCASVARLQNRYNHEDCDRSTVTWEKNSCRYLTEDKAPSDWTEDQK